MEKVAKSNYEHKEFMRLAMLKHEETFREQVYELHRVYRIQKMLMQSAGISQHAQQQKQQQQERYMVESAKTSSVFTIDYNQQQETAPIRTTPKSQVSNISNSMLLDRPDAPVLVGGPISRPQNYTQERFAESNTNNVNMMLDEGEVELTLSLGPSTQNPRRRRTESGHESLSSSSTGSSQTRKTSPKDNTSSSTRDQFTWGSSSNFPQVSEIEPGFSNGQQNNPPWMFQALSLKLT